MAKFANILRRLLLGSTLAVLMGQCFAQIHSRGAVTFEVPENWEYKPGPDFDSLQFVTTNSAWALLVHTPIPCTGESDSDVAAAWQGAMIRSGLTRQYPSRPYLPVPHLIGYPAFSAAGPSDDQRLYVRVYVLVAGNQCIVVDAMARNATALYSINHVVYAFLSSLRLAPLKATPIKHRLELDDLVGEWNTNVSSAVPYYNRYTGNFAFSDITGAGETIRILPDGHFTRHGSALRNNQTTSWEDSGIARIADGMLTLKGRIYSSEYRLIYEQESITGATVLTLLEGAQEERADTDGFCWVRQPHRSEK